MSKVHKLLLGSFILLTLHSTAHAHSCPLGEITPDNTLGKESSVVAPNATINGANADLINGGAQRGNNLFHSFTQFNIGDGQRVYFANPAGVQNILTRVTGGQASNIFGTLGVNGAANLFLINPSGILFGKNASLNLRGSFIGTTASSLKFADGTQFNALAPQSNQLLTISVPIGLQFGQNQPGAIVNAGNLAVEPGHNLSFLGGSVAVTGNIVAPGGEINIAAVPDNSLVEINQFGTLSSITSTATVTNTNNTSNLIELLKNTDKSDTGIKITGNNQIELENSITVSADVGTAIISALIDASTYQNGKTGGVVRILGDKVGLFNSTVIGVNGDAGGGTVFVGGDAGANKLINATNVFVDDHVDINASAINQGNGGNISVWSNGNTQFFGYATTLGRVLYGQSRYDTKTGNSGTVTIGARDGLIYKGLVNTYSQDDYSANKTGTLILNYPELTIVDTPLVNNNYANLSQDYNRISWETIANNLAINNLNLFSNGNVIINAIANNTVELEIPKPLNTRTTLGINSSDEIYFTNTKNTIITNGISIKWIANKDIITGNIRTNSPLDLSVGGDTGNIFLTSINGKINTSAGQLDTSTHYTNFSSHRPGIATGGVKLEAYGDIITSDIITTSINLYSNDIIIISKAGGIDTSSGRLDTSATRISPSGYSNPGSVTLGAYGKIRTGSIYTNGNAGGQIDITSYNDGIDTTSGTITAFAFYGSVGNININAFSDIYAGDITTDFTFKKFDGPFYRPFDTRKGRIIEKLILIRSMSRTVGK